MTKIDVQVAADNGSVKFNQISNGTWFCLNKQGAYAKVLFVKTGNQEALALHSGELQSMHGDHTVYPCAHVAITVSY